MLDDRGISCRSGPHSTGDHERANPSSSHLAVRHRGAEGGKTPLMYGCTPSFTRKQHLSFMNAKTYPVAHTLLLAAAPAGNQVLNQLRHSWIEFFLKWNDCHSKKKAFFTLSILKEKSSSSWSETYSFHTNSSAAFTPTSRALQQLTGKKRSLCTCQYIRDRLLHDIEINWSDGFGAQMPLQFAGKGKVLGQELQLLILSIMLLN